MGLATATATHARKTTTTAAQMMLWILIFLATIFDVVELKLLTKAQRKQMLDAHNYYRRLVVKEQGASNMQIMQWDADLEGFAYSWISKCKWAHSPKEIRYHHGGELYVGENIWATTKQELTNVSKPVETWYKEVSDYDWETKTCTPGEACGHYTQMVWHSSFKLGCAVSSKGQCNGKATMPRGLNVFVSCNYAPAGNWRKPKVFNKGDPCSNCTEEWGNYCIDGLCSKVATEEELPLEGYKGHGLKVAHCLLKKKTFCKL